MYRTALILARRYADGGAVNTDPSKAQKDAGNYKKKHVTFQGIPITIENPKGTIRKGKDHKGRPWSSRMVEDYGYIRRTVGNDGDQVDTFVGPHKNSNRVFIIDQLHHHGESFDEHKCLLGFDSKKKAIKAYLESYGKKYEKHHQIGDVTELSVPAFKEWLKGGGGKEPLSPEVPKFADGGGVDDVDPEAKAFDYPPMVSDEDIGRAQITKGREGGLLQNIPAFAQTMMSPEGRTTAGHNLMKAAGLTVDPNATLPVEAPGVGSVPTSAPPEVPMYGATVKPMVEMVKQTAQPMTPEQQADWATGVALTGFGASAPFRLAEPAGSIGVFGGKGAAGADLSALKQAEKMRDAGADPRRIWNETGWDWDPHTNEPFFHIPMNEARINPEVPKHPQFDQLVHIPEGLGAPLPQVLLDPQLYKHYPWLKDWTVAGENHMLEDPTAVGTAYPTHKLITTSPNTPEGMRSNLIHEVNHAIQDHEGLSQGANWRNFLPEGFVEQANNLRRLRDSWSDFLADNKIPVDDAYEAMRRSLYEPTRFSAADYKIIRQIRDVGAYNNLANLMERLRSTWEVEERAKDNYLSVHGEAMSRAAEYMARYTPEESRQVHPSQAMGMMRTPVAWEETLPTDRVPLNFATTDFDPAAARRDYANREIRSADATDTGGIKSERESRHELAAKIANELIERHGRNEIAISRELNRIRQNTSEATVEKIRQYLPSNLHLERDMTPAEAKQWLIDNQISHDPVGYWGYSDPKDYVRLANLRRGRPGGLAGENYRAWGGSGEDWMHEPPPASFAEQEVKKPFKFKPEELGIEPPPDYDLEEFIPSPDEIFGASSRPESFADRLASARNRFNQKFDEHIGPHMSMDQFYNDYFGGMLSSSGGSWGDLGFHFEGTLIKDGKTIGSIDRTFNPETKNAYHGYLRVDPSVRGSGLVPTMLANQIKLYQKLGIEKVKLSANVDVGGYAWAKYGFLPNEYGWKSLADTIKYYIDRQYVKPTTEFGAQMLNELSKAKDPKSLWVLSDLKDIDANTGLPLGKAILANKSWGGTLDLTNAEALNRFFAHVASKSKKP